MVPKIITDFEVQIAEEKIIFNLFRLQWLYRHFIVDEDSDEFISIMSEILSLMSILLQEDEYPENLEDFKTKFDDLLYLAPNEERLVIVMKNLVPEVIFILVRSFLVFVLHEYRLSETEHLFWNVHNMKTFDIAWDTLELLIFPPNENHAYILLNLCK